MSTVERQIRELAWDWMTDNAPIGLSEWLTRRGIKGTARAKVIAEIERIEDAVWGQEWSDE